MSSFLARILFVASLCFSIAASPARMAGTDPVGLITVLEGKAYIAREGVPNPLLLGEHDDVLVHDVIETQSHSRLKILFLDDSLVTIAENSRVAIQDYAHGGRIPSKVVIQLDRGAIRSSIGGHPSGVESTFEVQTPAASIAARDAYFTVWIDEGVPALIQGIEQSSATTKGTPSQGLLGPPAVSLRQVGLANIGQVGSVTLTSGGETTTVNPGQYLMALPNTGSLSPSTWTGATPFPIAASIAATDLKAIPKPETPKETLRLVGVTDTVTAGVSGLPPAALAPPVGQIRVPQIMMTPPFPISQSAGQPTTPQSPPTPPPTPPPVPPPTPPPAPHPVPPPTPLPTPPPVPPPTPPPAPHPVPPPTPPPVPPPVPPPTPPPAPHPVPPPTPPPVPPPTPPPVPPPVPPPTPPPAPAPAPAPVPPPVSPSSHR